MGNPYLDRLAKRGIGGTGMASEKRVTKSLGARAHGGSGSSPNQKSDATKGRFRMEMKSTKTDTLELQVGWLNKITQEALPHGQVPCVVISYVSPDGKPRVSFGEWALIPLATYRETFEEK